MVKLAVGSDPHFVVSEIEQGRDYGYTVETLQQLKMSYRGARLYLIVGADNIGEIKHWREPDEICRLALPVAVRRPGSGEPNFSCLEPIASPERIDQMRRSQVEMPEIGISSTELRRHVAAGRSIRFQVPRAVEEYIRTHGLYQS